MQIFSFIVSLCSTDTPCPPPPTDGTMLSWSMTINYTPGLSWFNIYQCLVRPSKKVTVLLHYVPFSTSGSKIVIKALSSVTFVSSPSFMFFKLQNTCTCQSSQHKTFLVDAFLLDNLKSPSHQDERCTGQFLLQQLRSL